MSTPSPSKKTNSFFGFFFTILAIYVCWLAVFWPGALGPDSIAILWEIGNPDGFSSGKSSLWHWFVRLTYMPHEHAEVPIAVLLLLGAIIQARILSWSWRQGLKKTTLLLALFITVSPHFIFFMGMLYPDGIYAIASTGLMFELWLAAREKRFHWLSLIMLALCAPFALFVRSNGLIFIIPIALLSIWLWRHDRRMSAGIAAVTLLSCMLNGLASYAHPSRGHGAVYPLVIFETVNFMQPRPMNLPTKLPRLSPRTIETLEKYHPVEHYVSHYDPDYWDPLFFPTTGPEVLKFDKADKDILTKEFFRYNLWRNIPKFIGSRVNVFLVSCLAQGGEYVHSYTDFVLGITKSKSEYLRFQLEGPHRVLQQLQDFSFHYRWLLWSPLPGLCLLAWALVAGLKRRNWPLLLVGVPMLAQWAGIFVFSIAGEYRYILPFFTLPLALLPAFVLRGPPPKHTAQ